MPIQWKDEFGLGIKIIDDQHKHFLESLNNLYLALEVQDAKTMVKETLDFLIIYVRAHFGTEEKYFVEFNYDGASAHVAAHESFKVKLDEICAKASDSNNDVLLELVDTMEDWLVQHILIVDKKYVKCFKEHGL